MLTLAFSQIVWAICFKWNDVTGGDQGLPERALSRPRLDVVDPRARRPPHRRPVLSADADRWSRCRSRRCAGSPRSPFGRMLTTIRENPERAAFIGLNVRGYELAAFVIAGGFAGIAGRAVRHLQPRRLRRFRLLVEIGRGDDHDHPRRHGSFLGTGGRRAALILLNQQITSYTEYWPFVLGTILLVLLFVFPGGIVGGARRPALRCARPQRWARRCLKCAGLTKSFAGFVAVVRRDLDRRAGRDRRGDRAQRRRQIDAVQPDHRPSAARQRPACCSTAATSPASRRTRSAGMGIGRSFQRTNIFPKLTVFENVQAAFLAHRGQGPNFWSRAEPALSRRSRGAARLDRARRAGARPRRHAVLRQPEAARARHRAGERSRFSCSTSRPPACRPSETHETIALIERIARERRLTLLFTEHDMAVVFSIAQKIAVMHQGRVIAHGDPTAVRADARGAPRLSWRRADGSAMMSCAAGARGRACGLRAEPRAVRYFARGQCG